MTTENVKYLIDAEDKASAKIRKSKAEVKKMVGEVKDLGGKSKASAELVGTLANQIGNTGAGAAAGEIGQLIERVSAFSEVAKEGGKGMMLLQGGILAAAGAMSFKLGAEIGKLISGFDKLERRSVAAMKSMAESADRLAAGLSTKFDQRFQRINLFANPDLKERELTRLLDSVAAEALAAAKRVTSLEEDIESYQSRIWGDTRFKHEIEGLQKILEAEEKRSDVLHQQKKSMEALLGPEAERLKHIKEQIEAVDREAAEKAGFLELRTQLNNQFEKLIGRGPEAFAEKAKARAKEVIDAQKELEREKLKATAERIAMEKSANAELMRSEKDRIRQLQQSLRQTTLTGPNTAGKDQRLLTGRASARFAKTAADIEAERQTKILESIDKAMDRLATLEENRDQIALVKKGP